METETTRKKDTEALALLGIAHRAGAVVRGVDATRRSLRSGDLGLVLLARDASPGQLGKVFAIVRHRDVPARWVDAKGALGRALSADEMSVAGVRKGSLADRIAECLPVEDSLSGPNAGPGGKMELEEEPRSDAGR